MIIDANGIQIQTYEEIFNELSAGYKAIYGNDISINPESPDGQRIAIEAKARLDMQTMALKVYNGFDPDLAQGLEIEKIGKISGVYRRPATRSTVDITVTTSQALTLPSGYRIEDDLSQIWLITSDQTLTTGANTVTFTAEEFGAIEAEADTITSPVDVVLGVSTVTNPAAATVGVEEETDAEFRIRRNLSLELPALSTVGALISRLWNTAGVTDVVVYENDTDTIDAVRSIDAHTIWAIVEGGEVVDITEAIAKQKTGGTGLKGTVEGTHTDEIVKPDGTIAYYPIDVKFDRPTEIDLYIELTATRKDAAVPVDTTLIKQKLAAATYTIGETAQAGLLYDEAYEAGSTYIVTDLQISDDITYTDGLLTPGYDEKFVISTANITITEVTP